MKPGRPTATGRAGRPVAFADVFRAVADPTRRGVLDLLRDADRSVTELAAPFALTQPAISQHLRVLREAGLVHVQAAGRRRLYRLDAGPLRELYDWAGHFARFWPVKLGALGRYLDSLDGAVGSAAARSSQRRGTRPRKGGAKGGDR
jgi:DNA-binding transcriptional ArsR family regulator